MDNKPTKVLLLDDDPNLRDVLSDILKVKGFEPIPAATGAAALVQIEQQDIDVALIDIMLEDMPGLEVLRSIKTLTPEIECIMLTGHASQATAIEAVNLGAYSYFQKPYDVDQLLVSIRRAAEKHAVGHAIQESEARFRSMIENSSDLICILNPDATLRYVSPSLERLLGYTKEDVVIGTGLQDYIHPDDISVFMEAFRQHLQTSTPPPVPMQLRIRHKDGTWHTLEGTGSNLLEHPAIEGIVINARDVTARKQAEEVLKKQSEDIALINRLNQAINQGVSLGDFVHILSEEFACLFLCSPSHLYLLDGKKQSLVMQGSFSSEKTIRRIEHLIGIPISPINIPIGGISLYSRVFQEKKILLCNDAHAIREMMAEYAQVLLPEKLRRGVKKFIPNILEILGHKGIILMPLLAGEEPMGLLEVPSKTPFTDEDLRRIEIIAGQLTAAILRKRAEEALRQTTGLLESIFAGLHTMVAYMDADFNFIRVNQAYASADNQTPEYFIGKNHFVLYPNPENEAIFKGAVRSGKPYIAYAKPFEYAGHPERGISYWDWVVSPIKDEQGKVGNVILSIIDVTERARAEDAKRQAEIRYRSLFQQMHDAIFILDLKGRHLDANPRAAELLGYTPDEILELSFTDTSAQLRESKQALKRILAGEHIPLYERIFRKKNGDLVPVEINVELVRDDDGHPLHIQSVVRDITARKQAEEAIRKSEQFLRQTIDLVPHFIFAKDMEGRFLLVNKAVADAYGTTTSDIVGKSDIDFSATPEQASHFHEDDIAVIKGGKAKYIPEEPITDARGSIRYLQTSKIPFQFGIDNVPGILGVSVDITERKQAEEALHESEERYRQLVEHMPNGILIHVNGQIVFANSTGAKMLGPAAPEDLVGKRLLDFVHPDYQKIVKGRVKQITEKKKEVPLIEEKLIRLDRTVIDAEVTAIPFTYKNQNAVQVVFNDITERRQAEEARRQAEARYRSVVEQVPAIFYTETMDHKVIFVSSKIETILGYTPEEWMSDHDFWKKSVHPDDLERVTAEDESSNQSGEPFYTEYRVFRKDGRMIWLRDQAALVKDSGKPIFWQGVMYDISAEKKTEAALRTSEERYRMLAENMSDTIWLMDMSLRTTYISPSVTRLRGFTLEEINSIPLDQQMPSDSFQRILQLFAKILSPENLAQPDRFISRTIELEYFKKDGTKFWSENTFTLIRDPQGQPFAVLGSGRDISERKNAQEELQNSEKYFRALIENNTDAVVLIDTRGMILYESPAYARMMGRVPGQRLGKSGYEHIHTEDRSFVAQTLNELIRRPGETRRVTFRDQHKDGSWRYVEATATNLLGESAVHGLVINMHDITGRKQAEEEIRRRVADLEVLYENGLSISVLLEPRKIAQKMIEILSKKLDWHHASIRLYDPETGHVELLALGKPGLDSDQSRAEIERLNRVFTPSNQGLSGWVIKHGKTVRSGDVHADKRYLSTFRDINSGLYVPLMIGERAIGCIAVESRKLNRFSEGDERLLQTLAAQSAIAFENARLYQDALGAAKRKAALHQGSLEIVRAGQEIEALCIALHHAVQQVMPAEEFTVSLVTEDGREVEAPYLYDRGIIHPNTRLPVEAGITGRVIKSKKPLRIKDVQKSRGAKPIMVGEMEPTRAVLSVPLLAQNEVIGVISAQSHDTDVYSVEDQIFMETLASEAAVAFENARLFEEIRRRLTELETLSQVSVSLTSAIDLQPLLENILAGARRAIPASEKGTIFLAEPDGKLRLHAVSGYTDPRLTNLYLLPDQKGYASRVARERIPIKIDDAHAEYEIPDSGTIEEIDSVQSGIAAPLIVKGKVIGVISLDNASRKTAFIESDLRLLVTFASSAAVAIENARLFIETQQRLHRLSALHSIDATIGASVDTHVTLSIVLEHVMTELKADAAAVLLFNPLTRMLEYTAGRGFRVHAIEGSRIRLGEGLAGQTALQRRAIDIVDLQDADEVEQVMVHSVSESASVLTQRLEGENFVSYHSIPLIAKGQVQGVLEIFRRTPMQVDQEWITFFEMLAGQTAIAIDNGRLFENLQQSNLELTLAYDATIQGWSQALELRDEETEGHTRRVTDLTLRLVQAMNVDEVEMEHVRRGALLHDIGKMAVPDSILLKSGPLDPNEWSVMRQHPQYAFNLLSPISYLRPAIHIPYCHHEKWDGSGYPRGLKGEEIPLVARIFAIVDVFDALTSNRPYRLAWTREDALTYIREQSGKHFDPKVVKTFMDLMAGEQQEF